MHQAGSIGRWAWRGRVFPWAILAWVLMGLAGCVDTAQLADATSQARSLHEQLSLQMQRREQELEGVGVEDPARGELEEQLRRSRTVLETLEAGIAQVESATRGSPAANNPGDGSTAGEHAVGTIAGAVAGVVPTPWRVPIILVGGLAAAVLRARKLKLGLASIVRSIELAKREDGAFRERFRSNSTLIRTIQTPLAQRIVDDVSRGRVIASPI